MGVQTVNTAGTALATSDAAQAGNIAPLRPAPAFRAIVVIAVATLNVGLLFSSAGTAQAGLSDLFSSSSSQQQKPKRTTTKAGIGQGTKKPTTATARMLDSVASAPRKMMGNTMSALLPGKKPSTGKARTVPRKLVSDQKPSMLKRLFTSPEEKQPLTVTDWMAQPRPK